MSSVLGRGKSQKGSCWGIITVLFSAKNSRTSIDVWAVAKSWCKFHDWVLQNSKSMIGFCTIACVANELLRQSVHNFKVIFLNERTTLWQEFHCNRRKQWVKPSHYTELEVPFSILALLDAFIGMIRLWLQCHSHTLMIPHQLWLFWTNFDCCWMSSTSSERCVRDVVFVQNVAILERLTLPQVSCLKHD